MQTMIEVFRQEAEALIRDAEDAIGKSFNKARRARVVEIVTEKLRDQWENAYDDACYELESEMPVLKGRDE